MSWRTFGHKKGKLVSSPCHYMASFSVFAIAPGSFVCSRRTQRQQQQQLVAGGDKEVSVIVVLGNFTLIGVNCFAKTVCGFRSKEAASNPTQLNSAGCRDIEPSQTFFLPEFPPRESRLLFLPQLARAV